jgi:hypothetical protein
MEEWMNGFGGLSGLSGMIDPHQMGLFSLAAANNPQMMGPIFDQLGIPVPGSPGFAQFMGGGGGGELGGLINGTQVPAGTDTMPKPPALSPGVSEATAPLAGPPVASCHGTAVANTTTVWSYARFTSCTAEEPTFAASGSSSSSCTDSTISRWCNWVESTSAG